MKVIVNKQDLSRALSLTFSVARGFQCGLPSPVLLKASSDGLAITGMDDGGNFIRYKVDADVPRAGELAVPGKAFLEYVKRLEKNEVVLEECPDKKSVDGKRLAVSCGRNSARLEAWNRDRFELHPEASFSLEIPWAAIASAIRATRDCVPREDLLSVPGFMKLELDNDGLTAMGTDGYRLAYCRMDCGVRRLGENTALTLHIPQKALGTCLGAIEEEGEKDSTGMIGLGQDENMVFVRAGRARLYIRKPSGNFPETNRVLAYRAQTWVTVPREELARSVRRAALCSEGYTKEATFEFVRDAVIVSGKGSEGETEEQVPCDYEGDSVKFTVNAKHAIDFLEACLGDTIAMGFSGDQAPVEFRPAKTREDHRYLIMPLRR